MELHSVVVVVCAIFILLSFVPIYYKDLIEGKFFEKIETKGFSDSDSYIVYYFENYCRDCLEGKVRLGGSVWNCNETLPTRIWTIGSPPKRKGETVKLTAWFNIYGSIIIAKWTRSNFKLDPAKVKILSKKFLRDRTEIKCHHNCN